MGSAKQEAKKMKNKNEGKYLTFKATPIPGVYVALVACVLTIIGILMFPKYKAFRYRRALNKAIMWQNKDRKSVKTVKYVIMADQVAIELGIRGDGTVVWREMTLETPPVAEPKEEVAVSTDVKKQFQMFKNKRKDGEKKRTS